MANKRSLEAAAPPFSVEIISPCTSPPYAGGGRRENPISETSPESRQPDVNCRVQENYAAGGGCELGLQILTIRHCQSTVQGLGQWPAACIGNRSRNPPAGPEIDEQQK